LPNVEAEEEVEVVGAAEVVEASADFLVEVVVYGGSLVAVCAAFQEAV
jgi:hypothetical protein